MAAECSCAGALSRDSASRVPGVAQAQVEDVTCILHHFGLRKPCASLSSFYSPGSYRASSRRPGSSKALLAGSPGRVGIEPWTSGPQTKIHKSSPFVSGLPGHA
eukprot:scaffold186015_cov13-Tisochrysis_lutea.AAC.1